MNSKNLFLSILQIFIFTVLIFLSIYNYSNIGFIANILLTITSFILLIVIMILLKKYAEKRYLKFIKLLSFNILYISGSYLFEIDEFYFHMLVLSLDLVLLVDFFLFNAKKGLFSSIIVSTFIISVILTIVFSSYIDNFKSLLVSIPFLIDFNSKIEISYSLPFNKNYLLIFIPLLTLFIYFFNKKRKSKVTYHENKIERLKVEKNAIKNIKNLKKWAARFYKIDYEDCSIDYIFKNIRLYIKIDDDFGIEFLWLKYLYSSESLTEDEFIRLSRSIKYFLKEGVKKIG